MEQGDMPGAVSTPRPNVVLGRPLTEPEPMAAKQGKGCTTPSFFSLSLLAWLGTARRAEGRIWMLAENCRRALARCNFEHQETATVTLKDSAREIFLTARIIFFSQFKEQVTPFKIYVTAVKNAEVQFQI
jgi:hypothetical protein